MTENVADPVFAEMRETRADSGGLRGAIRTGVARRAAAPERRIDEAAAKGDGPSGMIAKPPRRSRRSEERAKALKGAPG